MFICQKTSKISLTGGRDYPPLTAKRYEKLGELFSISRSNVIVTKPSSIRLALNRAQMKPNIATVFKRMVKVSDCGLPSLDTM